MQQKQNLTIDDIARELGVSKTTVSRAISGKGRIGAATRERVLAYIESCNYRPSAAAKGLAENRTYNIALVLPREFIKLDLPFIRRSMSAICEEAADHGYNILLCMASPEDLSPLTEILDNRKVDGVILTRTMENDHFAALLANRGIPFATLGSLPEDISHCATVEADHDHITACRKFTSQLLRRSPEKTVLLGGNLQYLVNQRRLEGVRQAAAGQADCELIFHTGLSPKNCTGVLEGYLEQGVQQFLCMDDDICISVLVYLQLRQLRIPQDVRLASMYDNPSLKNHHPPISALAFDAEELGREACGELIKHLQGQDYRSKVMLGYQIHFRHCAT